MFTTNESFIIISNSGVTITDVNYSTSIKASFPESLLALSRKCIDNRRTQKTTECPYCKGFNVC